MQNFELQSQAIFFTNCDNEFVLSNPKALSLSTFNCKLVCFVHKQVFLSFALGLKTKNGLYFPNVVRDAFPPSDLYFLYKLSSQVLVSLLPAVERLMSSRWKNALMSISKTFLYCFLKVLILSSLETQLLG